LLTLPPLIPQRGSASETQRAIIIRPAARDWTNPTHSEIQLTQAAFIEDDGIRIRLTALFNRAVFLEDLHCLVDWKGFYRVSVAGCGGGSEHGIVDGIFCGFNHGQKQR
jgi:hypothetical protein